MQQQLDSTGNAVNLSSNAQQTLSTSNPQQQDSIVQYLLSLARQQIGNSQIQINSDETGGTNNTMMKQQLQLIQAMQQGQVQPEQVHQNGSQTIQTATGIQPIEQATLNQIPAHKPLAPKNLRRTKRANVTKTKSVITSHREATQVIGNTMKSLNRTMRSIHEMAGKEQAPLDSKANKRPAISGSMKSLSSTLASTMMAPPEPRGNASWENNTMADESIDALLGKEMPNKSLPMQQDMSQYQSVKQGTPMMAYAEVQNYQSDINQSYPALLAQNTAASNMITVSSDTDGELIPSETAASASSLSREVPMTLDKYATESGTDDELMFLGKPVGHVPAPSSAGYEKLKSTK